MEAAIPDEPQKVLARGTVDGQRLELVQDAAGGVGILQDGQPLEGIDLSAAGLDTCVRMYLRLLRQRPQPDS